MVLKRIGHYKLQLPVIQLNITLQIPFVTVDDLSSPSRSFSRVDICPPYLPGG
jgi:hypothetical protein